VLIAFFRCSTDKKINIQFFGQLDTFVLVSTEDVCTKYSNIANMEKE
jgi:hypothetical protein